MNFKGFGTEPPANGGGVRPPANSLLARQSSIYSLTFDELQNTMGGSLGKDFGSMNMEELLKNIWSAEEIQSMAGIGAAAASVIGPPSVSPPQFGGAPAAAPLQRQGSLTLPRTLSQKTVDEVWKSVSKDGNGGAITPVVHPRQQTLGEITLEEFLLRAGVVREDNNNNIDNNNAQFNSNSKPSGTPLFSTNNLNNSNLGMISGIMNSNLNPAPIPIQAANLPLNVNGVRSSTNHHHYQQPQQIFPKQSQVVAYGAGAQLGSPAGVGGGVMGLGSPGNQMSSDGVRSNGDTSSVSPVPFAFNGGLRGRKGGGAVEKVVERRQRRMIKNRESAARSRARKQAYTMELEAEVAKLKEENEELRKKQEHMIELQKNQAKELMKVQKGDKKRGLRRTQTGPW